MVNILYLLFIRPIPTRQIKVMNAVSRFIAVLMLTGMLLQINSVFVCFALFSLNQKAIAATLCERKVKNCCGHCFLLKKINSANDTQLPPTGKQASTKTIEELLNAMPGVLPDNIYAPLIIFDCNRCASQAIFVLFDGIPCRIDHPPRA